MDLGDDLTDADRTAIDAELQAAEAAAVAVRKLEGVRKASVETLPTPTESPS